MYIKALKCSTPQLWSLTTHSESWCLLNTYRLLLVGLISMRGRRRNLFIFNQSSTSRYVATLTNMSKMKCTIPCILHAVYLLCVCIQALGWPYLSKKKYFFLHIMLATIFLASALNKKKKHFKHISFFGKVNKHNPYARPVLTTIHMVSAKWWGSYLRSGGRGLKIFTGTDSNCGGHTVLLILGCGGKDNF